MREQDNQELRFLRSLRLAIPAALDANAGDDYRDREAELLDRVNGFPGASGT